jgi:hypothetical protein
VAGSHRTAIFVARGSSVSARVLSRGVSLGYLQPNEPAAMGAFALLLAGCVSAQLGAKLIRILLHDSMAITGALFTLLLAATTFTLVLRLFGTDQLVNCPRLTRVALHQGSRLHGDVEPGPGPPLGQSARHEPAPDSNQRPANTLTGSRLNIGRMLTRAATMLTRMTMPPPIRAANHIIRNG